jgi:hypothetical protein
MKLLLLFPVLAVAFSAISCRTSTPIDPMTMKPSCRCLPGHVHDPGVQCNPVVEGCSK